MIDLKILEEKENKLLQRKTLVIKATFEQATPSEAELKKAIATKTKAKEEVVAVKSIYQDYGAPSANVTVHIYKDAKTLKDVEVRNKKKAKGEEEKPAEAAPAAPAEGEAPKAEEKPAEEAPKEEAPAEEKKEEAKE